MDIGPPVTARHLKHPASPGTRYGLRPKVEIANYHLGDLPVFASLNVGESSSAADLALEMKSRLFNVGYAMPTRFALTLSRPTEATLCIRANKGESS